MTPVGSTLSPATSRATPQMANSPVRANGALEQPLKDVASPAVVNDVQSARNRFSYCDQVTTDTALMPFVRSLPEFSRAGAGVFPLPKAVRLLGVTVSGFDSAGNTRRDQISLEFG